QRLLDRQFVRLLGRDGALHAPHPDRCDGRVDRDVGPLGATHGTIIPGRDDTGWSSGIIVSDRVESPGSGRFGPVGAALSRTAGGIVLEGLPARRPVVLTWLTSVREGRFRWAGESETASSSACC